VGFWLSEGYNKGLLRYRTTCADDSVAHRAWRVDVVDVRSIRDGSRNLVALDLGRAFAPLEEVVNDLLSPGCLTHGDKYNAIDISAIVSRVHIESAEFSRAGLKRSQLTNVVCRFLWARPIVLGR
jgi:hypothetical protein